MGFSLMLRWAIMAFWTSFESEWKGSFPKYFISNFPIY